MKNTDLIIDGVSVSGKITGHEYVDLGLPSGTKWATCNIGATKPTETGDYFAWGETEPKEEYKNSTYKWGDPNYNEEDDIKKYCPAKYNEEFDRCYADESNVLEDIDDAAFISWGSEWRMPTVVELDELEEGCEWEYVENFNNTGIAGLLGTSKVNGNTIFLPKTSYYDRGGKKEDDRRQLCYWGATSWGGHVADIIAYDSKNFSTEEFCRDNGICIRAVLRSLPLQNNNNDIFDIDETGTLNGLKEGCKKVDCSRLIVYEGVKVIGNDAFCDCKKMISIVLPDSITKIGDRAFYNCNSLTSIVIPETVTEIGECAFSGCKSLTSIAIPESVTKIYFSAFHGCKSLTSIVIPGSVTEIQECAFIGCSGLTSISLPDSVEILQGFECCTGLTSFIIPDSVTGIGAGAFSGCSGLTSINIPDSVTEIEHSAFQNCSGLTSINIPDSVTSIGHRAFDGCSGLTSINIPDSVTKIKHSAFSGCSGLTSITIPESVTSIEGWAFDGCSGLTSINIPDSVTEIGEKAFFGCDSLTSIVIPETVTEIGECAFSCENLDTIVLPKHLKKRCSKRHIANNNTKLEFYEPGQCPQTSAMKVDLNEDEEDNDSCTDSEADENISIWSEIEDKVNFKMKPSKKNYVLIKSRSKGCGYVFGFNEKNHTIVCAFETFARKSSKGDFVEGISSDTGLKDKVSKAIKKAKTTDFGSYELKQGTKRKDKWAWSIIISYDDVNMKDVLVKNMNKTYALFESLVLD